MFISTVTEPQRCLPVRYTGYDVVVAGGGIAGISAALAAVRAGKRVLLLERMFALGGLATLGLVTIYLPLCDGNGHQLSYGLAEELLRLSISKGWERSYPDTWLRGRHDHGSQRFEVRYNAQVFAILAEQQLVSDGVKVLYGTSVCDVLKSGNRITHLIAESKDGRYAIPIRSVVDATGDADLFYRANGATKLYQNGNLPAAWFYETRDGLNSLRMIGAADVLSEDTSAQTPESVRGNRISGIDTDEISQALLACHAQSLNSFLAGGPASESHSLSALPSVPQLRMTRRMVGAYELDSRETHTFFDDSIGMTGDWRKRGPAYEIPLRTLYTTSLVNCMAAGRIISVTDDMWDITRVIPTCAVTGQAAGLAMAMTNDILSLSPTALQQALKKQSVKLHLCDIGL